MKIIIETSESERVALQPQNQAMLDQGVSGSIDDLVAVDAGPPSEALLQSLSNRADTQALSMDGESEEGYQSMVMGGAEASFSRH
jgi:hypothetical protein